MINLLTIIITGLSLLGSVSIRPAKIDTCQFDYEITNRIETKQFYLSVLFERENDTYYRVQNCGFSVNFLNGQYYNNEAKGINTQEISITPISVNFNQLSDYTSVISVKMYGGIGRIWTYWKNPKNVVVIGAEAKYTKVKYSTDFSKMRRLSISFSPQLALTENFFIVPECLYEKMDEKSDWQFKILGKWTIQSKLK